MSEDQEGVVEGQSTPIPSTSITERVKAARAQTNIAELETLIAKLTEVDIDHRNQIAHQQKEISRLHRMEIEASKFARMVTLPNGDLYVGAVYEAYDADGDGIVDTHRLIHERQDTIVLTEADRRKMAQLQKKLQGMEGDPEKDALAFSAASEGSGVGSMPEAESIIDAAVAAAEQDL